VRDPRRPRNYAWPRCVTAGPRHIVRRGKTPVLDPAEARQLIDAIDTSTVIRLLPDRALIGLMVYSFARIGAAIGMRKRLAPVGELCQNLSRKCPGMRSCVIVWPSLLPSARC
jgi:hypothetical protein